MGNVYRYCSSHVRHWSSSPARSWRRPPSQRARAIAPPPMASIHAAPDPFRSPN